MPKKICFMQSYNHKDDQVLKRFQNSKFRASQHKDFYNFLLKFFKISKEFCEKLSAVTLQEMKSIMCVIRKLMQEKLLPYS